MGLRIATLAILAAAAIAAGCASPSAVPPPPVSSPDDAAPGRTVIEVALTDFAITPKIIVAPAGRVRFEVVNRGVIEHDFHIPVLEGPHAHAQRLLRPGERRTFAYTVRPGTYEVVCTIPGHREAGMVATLDAGS
ncbi:MAG: cupredoxin domain-containing protein [Armatimonadota bacterium]|nr:cupredoxin domain-containing protein [Armatimonadota bacterium]MDR7421858.1 cupredoxin domain-containing protein [Armatimonadota bacterium]MDR7452901.1 cupredoxin domain-containing protein [Armatimonadota bacterium]MDR7456211.1 cupredoxin domain-containing protein [Armatimonadota bacterium]MDR7497971.1 cupredoxin domain-containing protein [Armatimonadota bacterium]